MTPTREQLIEEIAGKLWLDLCEGDGQHSESLDKALIRKHLDRLAACLAAPPQAQPEPQAMPPIEPDDWVELEQWPNCEWVVLSVDSDGRVSLIGLDLRYRIRDVIGISKANGTVWTREPRR